MIARPSAYALNKLELFDYIELWYFSTEGCTDASINLHSTNKDTFELIHSDNTVAIHSIVSSATLHNVVRDQDLTWEQMLMVKNNYLKHLHLAAWPDKHIQALSDFFFQLEMHEMQTEKLETEVLLTY